MDITWKGSPNFTKGRQGNPISLIVIHWFGVGTLDSANARFQNAEADASAHYGISDNTVYQWVKEEDTAWHAGDFSVNLKSIGIEHDATTTKNASDKTYTTSANLLADISLKYKIPLDRAHVKGHKEISATQCPGTIDIDKLLKLANEILEKNSCNSCENELHDMRDSRDKWKADYKQLEKLYKENVAVNDKKIAELEQALEDSRKDVEILQNRIKELEKHLYTNTLPVSEYPWKEILTGIVTKLGGEFNVKS